MLLDTENNTEYLSKDYFKSKICPTCRKEQRTIDTSANLHCSGIERKQSSYESWPTFLRPNLQLKKTFLFIILLLSVCTADKPESKSYGSRWWWESIENLTNLGRFMLGEDPLLFSGKYEGDVLLPRSSGPSHKNFAEEKNAVAHPSLLWPDGVVVYEFSDGYDILPFEKFLIIRAMKDIEQRSCVTFVRRTYEEDYVKIIFDSYKCYSNIGRVGGEQVLSLGFFCVMFYDRGNVYHELFHVLGFHHEHNRPDRDRHIDVMWSNIKEEAEKNFQKRSDNSVDTLNLPYDIDSVMHYSPHAFSKLYLMLPTIVSHDRGIFFTRSRWPSEMDYSKLNKLYECSNRRQTKLPYRGHHSKKRPFSRKVQIRN